MTDQPWNFTTLIIIMSGFIGMLAGYIAVKYLFLVILNEQLLRLVPLAATGGRLDLDDVAEVKAEARRAAIRAGVGKRDGEASRAEVERLCDLTADEILRREDPEVAMREMMYLADVRIRERGETITQDVMRAVRIEVLRAADRESKNRQEIHMKLLTMRQDIHKILILVQEEARKNPGFDDLFSRTYSAYERLAELNPSDPNAGVDMDKLADLIENIMIRQIKKDAA
jgi:hypothetical protein